MVSCHLYHAGNIVLKITRLQINEKRSSVRLKRLSNYELRFLKKDCHERYLAGNRKRKLFRENVRYSWRQTISRRLKM